MSGLLTPHYRVMTANDGRMALDVIAKAAGYYS
jgi:hypothetical protein